MSICEIYLDAMYSFSLVFLLCLKDELFKNSIGTCNDADKRKVSQIGKEIRKKRMAFYLIDNISEPVSCFLPRLTLSQ